MRLRLGSIAFINSLPVDLGMISKAVPCPAEIVQGVPAQLNVRLIEGSLDLSPCSALWYARHAHELMLLPELSISSLSGVRSVLLFSKRPLSELENVPIATRGQGRTTPALLEILCRNRYGFAPELAAREGTTAQLFGASQAVLLIGDEALVEREAAHPGWQALDLAESWKAWTGLPIVFAVWAVRRDVERRDPKAVAALHEAILKSKRWGAKNTAKIISAAAARTGLSESSLRGYFSGLSHDLTPELRKGMDLYLELAQKAGILTGARHDDRIGTAQ